MMDSQAAMSRGDHVAQPQRYTTTREVAIAVFEMKNRELLVVIDSIK